MGNDRLEAAIRDITNRFGDRAIMRMDDARVASVEAFSTGSLHLDMALGVGGLPRGRIVEIYGPENYGKTSLAVCALASLQAMGEDVAIVDMEHALDPAWAAKLGLDMNSAYIAQPDDGNQAMDIVLALGRAGAVGAVLIDSIAALVPRSELEKQAGDVTVAALARLLTTSLQRLGPLVKREDHKTTFIFTNQQRFKIGGYGNPIITPGGNAMKYWSTVRIQVKKDFVARVVKNKVAPPYREGIFTINENGLDRAFCVIRAALDMGVITKSGAWYYHNGKSLAQGFENAVNILRSDMPFLKQIALDVYEKFGWPVPDILPNVDVFGYQTEPLIAFDETELGDTTVPETEDLSSLLYKPVGEAGLIEAPEVVEAEVVEADEDERQIVAPNQAKEDGYGIPMTAGELAEALKEQGVFPVSGSWIYTDFGQYHGWNKLYSAIEDDPELRSKMYNAYLEAVT